MLDRVQNLLKPIFFVFRIHCPADTGRKLNVHKTLRRHPGRLLNVLCTFNLRFVSTGWLYELAGYGMEQGFDTMNI